MLNLASSKSSVNILLSSENVSCFLGSLVLMLTIARNIVGHSKTVAHLCRDELDTYIVLAGFL